MGEAHVGAAGTSQALGSTVAVGQLTMKSLQATISPSSVYISELGILFSFLNSVYILCILV